MNKRPNKPNRPNYFQQNIQKFGPDFLKAKNADVLQTDAIRIFRDIARGNVNIEVDGPYFLDPQFMESCITAATLKLSLHTINYNGVLGLVNSGINDPMTLKVLDYNKRSMEGYNIILTHLNNIRSSGDPNYLMSMASNLHNYRFNI